MAKAQHRTPEYRAAYRAIRAAQAAGHDLWCVEPVCLMSSRVIHPHQAAHVCHDTTGTTITGPGHAKCNTTEAAIRGNRMRGRAKASARWAL